MKNTFWIGANVLFDLETGKTTEVMLLVSREDEATTFNKADADLYLSFVKRRRPKIHWLLEVSKERPKMWVIKGIQVLEGDTDA